MKKILDISYLTIFSLFCAVIPFTDLGEAIPNIILIVVLILFPFVVKNEDWGILQHKSIYTLFFLVVVIIIQSAVLGRWEDFNFISRLVWLLLILITSIPIKNKLVPIMSFVTGAFVLLILSSINLIAYYTLTGELDMTTGDHVSSVLLGDRPYIGYVYVLGFCLSLYLSNLVLKAKFWFYALAVVFFVFLSIISARISLISIGVIVFSYVFYTKNFKKMTVIALAFIFFSIIMFKLNPSLRKRFFISSNNYKIEKLVKFEPRYFIWSCGYRMIFDAKVHLIGKGFVAINKELETCYSERVDFEDKKQQDFFIRSKFNTHNQFLNLFLSLGVFSFVLFITFFIFWFKRDYKNYFAFTLLLSIVLFSSVENVLSRQMGVELFALALIFSNMITVMDQSKHDKVNNSFLKN